MYYPRFTKVIVHYFLTKDKTISRRNKIGMHTSRDDYLINTLRFVSANEESQIYGARLPESMTISPEEPTRKSKRVKRPAKKSTNAPTAGVVIRDTPAMSLSKKKEKMTVEKRKGIELLSEVTLTEEAQYEEVRKKSLRDFHKTHPIGSSIVTKIAQSAAKIKPSVTNEGTGAKPGVPDAIEEESTENENESWGMDEDDSNNDHDSSSEGSDQESDSGDDNTQSDKEKGSDFEHETDENETGSESDQEENEEEVEDDEEKEDEFVKTPSNYNSTDDEDETNVESKDENKAEVNTDEGFIQKEGTDAEMINVQQGNENLEITLNQVIEDAHVTISTVAKKTEVPVTSSSHSSDLASKFLKFSDIPHTDAEIVSPMDVHVHHEVPSNQTPTLLTVPVSVITESSPVYTTVIPQSLPSFTPPPPQSTPTPPPTTEATNPISALPNFASVFQFNNRVSALEKDVAELKKDDLLNTQVTALVDEHLDSRLGATRDEFMSYLSASITARITKQVKIQLPQILPKEVSNFAPPVIKSMVTESLEHAVLAKESSQPQSTYEAAASLTEFELNKILIDKMDESQSYLTTAEHKECYDGLIKSYDLDKSLFSTYDKVYSLKRSRKDKDKDEDSSAGSDRGLKKRKTSKDAKPKKSVQAEEPEFEVADTDMPQDQEEILGNDDEEPKRKTPQQGPTQSWLMTLASSADKLSKTFDELMSTPIDFSVYIMNGLKITNLTQETLLGPAFQLLKGTRTNFTELEYDFEECYKALSEKLDWDNPEGGDYPFDLTKPLPLVMNGNRQMVPVDYFFNNDFKYLQGGISTMTYTTSTTKTKAAQYDLSGIEDMVPNIWSPVKVAYDKHAKWGISHWREQRKTFYAYARGLKSIHDVYFIKRIRVVTQVEVMQKNGYGYLREIEVRKVDNELYTFKEGDFPRLRINDIEDMLILTVQNRLTNLLGDDVADFAIALRMFTRSLVIQKRRDPYTPYQDPQGFIYVEKRGRNMLMRSDELYKFSDDTLTRLRSSLGDITKNIQMEYLSKRRWSSLEKKRAHIMIKAIDKQLKERRMMRSLEKFVGGRHYGTDLRLLQRII
ncbi:hypothetical protein Tco_0215286 [Tanacetum coccineum]